MATKQLTFKDLQIQIADLRDRHPRLSDDELFVAWFLRAYITENEEVAVRAVAGGARDKGIDAVFIDDAAKAVFIVQSKYRKVVEGKPESRSDVMSFANLAHIITDLDTAGYREFVESTEAYAAELLQSARKRVTKDGYRLWLYYVTLGKCSTALEKDALQAIRGVKANIAIEILAGKRIMLLLRDYLDGAAPPIPTLDLEMESGQGVTVNGILQRYDTNNEIESWVFSMRGSAVGELFEQAGIRLFARNIRGFMGDTPVNRGMTRTLQEEADHFFYYNNGVTIVCDRAERISSKGKDVLRVSNPQVINGQQTTRVLALNSERVGRASVLVKVIRVPRDEDGTGDGFDDLISRIVAGTNWQNAIRPSDLMANDRKQIDLERTLRKLGYTYLRKRQTKSEAKRLMGNKRSIVIKKEDLAQAVAGCELDPVVARSGKDNLFEEQLYPIVFPNSDPAGYLSKYWLMQQVTARSKGYPQRGYAKWLVLGFLWSRLAPIIRSQRSATAFRIMWVLPAFPWVRFLL